MTRGTRQHRGAYRRYSEEQKQNLLRQVLIHKLQIKEAAKNCNFRYSTAKDLVKRFKMSDRRDQGTILEPQALDLDSYGGQSSSRLSTMYVPLQSTQTIRVQA